MRLPRCDLARLALYAGIGDDPHHRACELAAKQMTRLVAVAGAAEVVEVLPPAQGLGKVLRPLLLWLIGLAVIAPRPLCRLLGGPRVAGALRWFENYVGRPKPDAALVHMWSLNRAGDTEVTHGHPLAVRLAIQLVQFVFAGDQVLPSVRSVFDERLPVDETTTFQDATVGDYLLLRFFQRIPGAEEMPEREAAREIFARHAAPRVLDRRVIRALLPASWSAENMRAPLAQLSFVSRQSDNFVLHPLLRDLLVRRLREVPRKTSRSRTRRSTGF